MFEEFATVLNKEIGFKDYEIADILKNGDPEEIRIAKKMIKYFEERMGRYENVLSSCEQERFRNRLEKTRI